MWAVIAVLFSEECKNKVSGLKGLGESGCEWGCGENSNELMFCVEDRELNEWLSNWWLLGKDCSA